MDLNILFASQVETLQQCYADLGHAPQRLQQALQAAIDTEVDRTHAEVDDAKACVEDLRRKCQVFKDILTSDGAEAAASSSGTGPRFYEGTYLARIEAWQGEMGRLERQYIVRRAHVDRQIETLEGYRPILGDFVPLIEGSDAVAYQRQHATAYDGANIQSCSTASSIPTAIPNLQAVEAALAACTTELKHRNEVLDTDTAEVAQLWAELALMPAQDDDLDQGILQHLQIAPRLIDVGDGCFDFCGEFEEAPANLLSDDEGVDGVCETPTRASGSYHQLSGPTTLVQKHRLAPTNDILLRIAKKRADLEEERTQRTDRLQAVYDELIPLWRRFDVADEDVDAFVQANCGCTMPVLEAYESELKQMLELKSQHMALFISKVREDIAHLWDQLMMSTEERQDSFAPFFYDLAEVTSDIRTGGVEPSDELLALHEEKVRELGDDLASRARPLELVRQYLRLLEEASELEASAKDTSRLTGRGMPGQRRDPGRLLREEKMRKRIKIVKPKIEEELKRTIPAWEEEAGRPFVVNGERFLDSVNLQVPVSPKKRQRTASQNQLANQAAVAAALATPQPAGGKKPNVNGSQQRSTSANAMLSSSSARKGNQAPPANASASRSAQPQSKIRPPQTVTRPQSAQAIRGPTATPLQKPQQYGASKSTAAQRTASASSAASSQSGHGKSDVTAHGILADSTQAANGARAATSALQTKGPVLRPVHGQQRTNPLPAMQKRPSMLLEASFRAAPRGSSTEYIKPTLSGAGATLRPPQAYSNARGPQAGSAKTQAHHASHGHAVEDSIGPNWAVLDEDDENLLMF